MGRSRCLAVLMAVGLVLTSGRVFRRLQSQQACASCG